jgi:ribose-phosphate pyrophosphokinase
MAICDKYRKRANEIAGMTVIGEVEGRNIILIDDICDTAGTLSKAADLLMEKGALSVRAVCTHAVLSGKAIETINNSKLTELVVTDTIPLGDKKSDKIRVLSVGELFAKAIRCVHDHDSISSLFIN